MPTSILARGIRQHCIPTAQLSGGGFLGIFRRSDKGNVIREEGIHRAFELSSRHDMGKGQGGGKALLKRCPRVLKNAETSRQKAVFGESLGNSLAPYENKQAMVLKCLATLLHLHLAHSATPSLRSKAASKLVQWLVCNPTQTARTQDNTRQNHVGTPRQNKRQNYHPKLR